MELVDLRELEEESRLLKERFDLALERLEWFDGCLRERNAELDVSHREVQRLRQVLGEREAQVTESQAALQGEHDCLEAAQQETAGHLARVEGLTTTLEVAVATERSLQRYADKLEARLSEARLALSGGHA